MKLRARLLGYTAAVAITAGAAFAAIDGNALAEAYLAEGYEYVEVKVGPTQTKVEAIKGTSKVEVIYDNETQAILKQETEGADEDEIGSTGSEVETVDEDFTDGDDEDDVEDDDLEDDDLEDDDDDGEDDDGEDDGDDSDDGDDGDDGEGDDGEGGDDGDGGDDGGESDGEGGED